MQGDIAGQSNCGVPVRGWCTERRGRVVSLGLHGDVVTCFRSRPAGAACRGRVAGLDRGINARWSGACRGGRRCRVEWTPRWVVSDAGVVPVTSSSAVASGISSSSRLYFLDWIRVLALFVVFLQHAVLGLPFLAFSWTGGAWDVPVFFFGIGLFFVVSGASSLFSLERRSSTEFIRERVSRLAIPYLVGGAILFPLAFSLNPENKVSSFTELWEGSRSYWSTAPTGLVPQGGFGSWLWVLAMLFLIALVSLPLLNWLRSERSDYFMHLAGRVAALRGGLLLWSMPVILLVVAVEYVLFELEIQPTDPAEYFRYIYTGWGAFPRYCGLFLLGAVLVVNRKSLTKLGRDWKIALAILAGSIFVGERSLDWLFQTKLPNALVAQAVACVGSWSLFVVVAAVGQRYWNQSSKLLAYSLGIIVAFYVLHAPVIAATTRVVLSLDNSEQFDSNDFTSNIFWNLYSFSPVATGTVVAVLSLVVLVGFIELVVRPIGPLRALLGVTKERFPGYPSRAVVAGDDPAVVGSRDGDTLGARSDGGEVDDGASAGN